MSDAARDWLERIRALDLRTPVKIMNVCGGHERSIGQAGLRAALPEPIELIPGPGCPVCICPEEAVHEAIRLALNESLTLVTFGDMLRVPVNVPKGDVAFARSGARGRWRHSPDCLATRCGAYRANHARARGGVLCGGV